MRRLVSKEETSGMKKKSGATKQSKNAPAMPKRWTVGIDLGDQWSRYCVLDEEGEVMEEGRFKTTTRGRKETFFGFGAQADCNRGRYPLTVGQ